MSTAAATVKDGSKLFSVIELLISYCTQLIYVNKWLTNDEDSIQINLILALDSKLILAKFMEISKYIFIKIYVYNLCDFGYSSRSSVSLIAKFCTPFLTCMHVGSSLS